VDHASNEVGHNFLAQAFASSIDVLLSTLASNQFFLSLFNRNFLLLLTVLELFNIFIVLLVHFVDH